MRLVHGLISDWLLVWARVGSLEKGLLAIVGVL